MIATFLRHYFGARRRFVRLSGDSLTRFQDGRARRIAALAAARSPFYRERWAGCDLDDWRTLPTADKRAMMADFTRFNTRGVDGGVAMAAALAAEASRDFRPTVPGTDLTVGLSTGTSGHRGMFLVSPQERAMWAAAVLARALPGPLWRAGGWRVSLLHRSPSNLYDRIRGRFVRFHFHDLATPLEETVARLNDERPHILLGPPTLLGSLADERAAGRLKVRPERVFSVAEVLEPQDDARIAAAFDLPALSQIYQCTEGLLAASCPHRRLHLTEDLVAVQTEPLPGGRAAPILTDLWRTTQPIFRYRLGDVLTLSAPDTLCACGSRFRTVERIEGRQDDVLTFLTPGGKPKDIYPDTIRRAVLLASGEIADYAAEQRRPGEIRVFLEPTPGADLAEVTRAVRAELSRVLAESDCRAAEIEFSMSFPSSPPQAKRRRVRNLWRGKTDV